MTDVPSADPQKFITIQRLIKNLDGKKMTETLQSMRDILMQISDEERMRISTLFEGLYGDEYIRWQQEEKSKKVFNEKVGRAIDIYVYRNVAETVATLDASSHWNDGGYSDSTIVYRNGASHLSRLRMLSVIPSEHFDRLEELFIISHEKILQSEGCSADHLPELKQKFLEVFQAIQRASFALQFEPEVFAAIPFSSLPKRMNPADYIRDIKPPSPSLPIGPFPAATEASTKI